jgi:hypothetical protein
VRHDQVNYLLFTTRGSFVTDDPTAKSCAELLFVCAILFSTCAASQGLDQFKPSVGVSDTTIRQAVDACVTRIRGRVSDKVWIAGPCVNSDGKWAGLKESEASLVLTFAVSDDFESSGNLSRIAKGRMVEVSCTTDVSGHITAFADAKASLLDVGELSSGICSPPGRR